jgi:IMP dehydrogenase/GMP reductase
MEKFDFNDILIKPSITSDITSRRYINLYTKGKSLPLITAPMDTVIDENNIELFNSLKIVTCLPRNTKFNRNAINSFSLKEFNNITFFDSDAKYLIDIANGHMSTLLETVKTFKNAHPNTYLMVGNVANPETYRLLSEAGADAVRVGIGNGNGCSTTVHTGIGFPMASLIKECYDISCELDKPAKIVADGGMKNYSDIIKALALGADYVMVGSLFNKAIESCGDNYIFKHIKISNWLATYLYKFKLPIYKKFRGMSTKEVQIKWGKEKLTTSEGVVRVRKVEYSLSQWVNNFKDYLSSAMSYSNAENLDQFIGQPEIIKVSDNAYLRFKK